MNATEYISCLLLLLFTAVAGVAQERVLLGEVTIKGEIRQPNVAMFSSRIPPEFRKLQVEKSFLTEIRQPLAEVVELNSDIRAPYKIGKIETLLLKERQYKLSGRSKR
ncbi:MAG: hypothetical protein ISR91_04500 [Candidatus Delongbacteria bacterium]|nr:hypothetical protein [Candidatus Delongbacteria bacterium]